MNNLLVIIVSFNGLNMLEHCLDSVRSSKVPADILLVDNCSSDGTVEWVESRYPEVSIIRNSKNLGFSKANSIGMRKALELGYEYVYLLNQDAWVFPETFDALIRVMESSKGKYGILSPMQMVPGLTKMDPQFKKHCSKAISKKHSETVPVRFVMAAHWLISRNCMLETGVFAPIFEHYGEDNNFIHRARYHGFKAGVVKTASAVHDREKRKRPRSFRMRLKVINAMVNVADPRRLPFFSVPFQCMKLYFMGILHFSAIPWSGVRELRSMKAELLACRKECKKKGAYIDL